MIDVAELVVGGLLLSRQCAFLFKDNGCDVMACLSGSFLPSRSVRLQFLINPLHPLSSTRFFGSRQCLLVNPY